MKINVNYHSSIQIGNIYVDPYGVREESNDAKYIFITHSHYDHYSREDINKVINDKTIVVCTEDVGEDFKKYYNNEIIVVEPNKEYNFKELSFETFPSYNINKKYHPLSNKWVGYLININGERYCVVGDSDVTDELKSIRCEVLFVPIGGVYTMNAKEASELVNVIKPKLVVPVHYNGIVGSKDDERTFLKGLKDIQYKILL